MSSNGEGKDDKTNYVLETRTRVGIDGARGQCTRVVILCCDWQVHVGRVHVCVWARRMQECCA